jgi:SGNH hydrolase-like domain, acetyltransferase AlgX
VKTTLLARSPIRLIKISILLTACLIGWAPQLSKAAEMGAADSFRKSLLDKVASLSERNIAAVEGAEGWLFLTAELKFLSAGQFWNDTNAKVSLPAASAAMDPFAAIVDFNKQLQSAGVHLLLVPVPPKASIYPEKLFSSFQGRPDALWVDLQRFYGRLADAGVDVIDLLPLLYSERNEERGPLYCRTDSHWSDLGCVIAAKAIAEHIRSLLPINDSGKYQASWNEIAFTGDLVSLLPESAGAKLCQENVKIRQVQATDGTHPIEPDKDSPLLLMGDSHTLVFHDFLAEKAGLLDQLTLELGLRPDLIGTRGSGATAVRVSLYRRGIKEPGYIGRKKVVVWCFSAREFTEATPGWQLLPISK